MMCENFHFDTLQHYLRTTGPNRIQLCLCVHRQVYCDKMWCDLGKHVTCCKEWNCKIKEFNIIILMFFFIFYSLWTSVPFDTSIREDPSKKFWEENNSNFHMIPITQNTNFAPCDRFSQITSQMVNVFGLVRYFKEDAFKKKCHTTPILSICFIYKFMMLIVSSKKPVELGIWLTEETKAAICCGLSHINLTTLFVSFHGLQWWHHFFPHQIDRCW